MDIGEVLEFADHLVFAMTGKHLDSLQQAILRGAWECQKYREIAEAHHRSEVYVKEVGFKLWQLLSDILGEAVNQGNFRATLERRWRFSHFLPFWKAFVQRKEPLNNSEYLEFSKEVDRHLLSEAENQSILSLLPSAENIPRQDLGEAPEVCAFYGRTEELNLLKNWLVKEQSPLQKGGTGSRLVLLLGMSGIGKTTLAFQLVEQIKDKFDYVIWRSLRSAPPLESLGQNLQEFFLNYLPYILFNNHRRSRKLGNKDSISKLIEFLRKYRCLVILADVEMLFSSGKLAGYYRSGYQDYGCLFKQVAELSHQSCFLLITSEAPKEISVGTRHAVSVQLTNQSCHSLQLNGLSISAAREVLIQQGLIPDENWDKLIEQYQGNPPLVKHSFHHDYRFVWRQCGGII